MKKIMEMLQNMKAKNEKKDNKGFSLVELIIVIAIMAILVGIVGTQVLPYINKSKEAKDVQLINSYSTAAVSAYSMLAGELSATSTTTSFDVNVYADKTVASGATASDANKIAAKIVELTGYDTLNDLKNKMTSANGKKVSEIKITFNAGTHTVVTEAVSTGLDKVNADL